tara:strand:- start:8966 stop:10027 length:1062 start_codon:yes stop_codon:yes gene_type:complete
MTIEANTDYYKKGKIQTIEQFTKENIIISNSSLRYLNKEEGGSIKRFQNFFLDNTDEEEYKHLTVGQLIHKYIDKPDLFIVAEVDKPTDMMCLWVNEVIKLVNTNQFEQIEVLDTILLSLEDAIVQAHKNTGVYSNMKKEDKILEKFNTEAKAYYDFITNPDNKGKELLTKEQKKLFDNIIPNLKQNTDIYRFLFQELFSPNCRIESEFEISSYIRGYQVKCKMDKIIIDYDNKTIWIIDPKTTSKPINNFNQSIEKYHYYRQQQFYKIAVMNHYTDLITDGYTVKFRFIAMETITPYECKLIDIDELNWVEVASLELGVLFDELDNWFTTPVEKSTLTFGLSRDLNDKLKTI